MPQQSFYIAIGVNQIQSWGISTFGTFPPLTYSTLGGVTAPDDVRPSGTPLGAASAVVTNPSQVIPTQLDTRTVVLTTPSADTNNTGTPPPSLPSSVVNLSTPPVLESGSALSAPIAYGPGAQIAGSQAAPSDPLDVRQTVGPDQDSASTPPPSIPSQVIGIQTSLFFGTPQ